MARAKELLDLISSPTAIATGVLIAFARNQLTKNDQGTVDRRMTRWALVSAALALGITGAVVAVMTPLAARVLTTNEGGVETRLLVYVLMFLVAIGTTGYAGQVVHSCGQHLWPAWWPDRTGAEQ